MARSAERRPRPGAAARQARQASGSRSSRSSWKCAGFARQPVELRARLRADAIAGRRHMADDDQHLHRRGPGGANPQALELKRANRHGLIAGATGTGKTVTIQGIIDGFSRGRRPVLRRRREGRPVGPGDGRLRRPPRLTTSSPRAPRRSARPTGPMPTIRCSSGTCSASRATRSAPPISEMGPLLLVAPDGPQRGAGRRADDRLPRRRQGRAAAARPRRSPGDAGRVAPSAPTS